MEIMQEKCWAILTLVWWTSILVNVISHNNKSKTMTHWIPIGVVGWLWLTLGIVGWLWLTLGFLLTASLLAASRSGGDLWTVEQHSFSFKTLLPCSCTEVCWQKNPQEAPNFLDLQHLQDHSNHFHNHHCHSIQNIANRWSLDAS